MVQEGHPVAYESRKLNDRERRYSAHEKEIAALVHCLRVGARFVVRSSHNVLCDTEEGRDGKSSEQSGIWC